MSQLETNTTTIDELITMANNLPDAGTGGGITAKTCKLAFDLPYQAGDNFELAYVTLTNGDLDIGYEDSVYSDSVIEPVLCNTIVVLMYQSLDLNTGTSRKIKSANCSVGYVESLSDYNAAFSLYDVSDGATVTLTVEVE